MPLLFDRGVNLKEFFYGSEAAKNRRAFGEAVTRFLRAGFYDGDEVPRNVGSRSTLKRFVGGEVVTVEPEKLYRGPAGELVTVDQLTGLQPHAPKVVYDLETPADTQYLSIFDVVQSDAESETYDKVTNAISFKQLVPGEKPDISHWSGTPVSLVNLKWGAAFGFDNDWINDNKVWKIEDTIRKAKEGAFDAKATFMYTLLLNASFNSTAYATSWIASLNAAIARLKRAKRLAPNQRPVVVCNVEKEAEVIQAIKDSLTVGARGERLTVIPDVLATAYYASTDHKVDVLVPKRYFKLQEREALRSDKDKDVVADSQVYAWFFRMNAVVLETSAGERITYT